MQMAAQLQALALAGISVFSVALSNTADENNVRDISSVPRLSNINYFLSPSIANLNSFSGPLSEQVFDVHQPSHIYLFNY